MDDMAYEKIIRAVEKRPILYDITQKLYKNNGYRTKLWNEVSLEVQIPVDLCQKTWKRLRERYTELNKKIKSGSSATKPNKYFFLIKLMGFLQPFVNDNPRFISSSFIPITSDTDDETNSSSISLREFFAETDPDTLDDNFQIEYENRINRSYESTSEIVGTSTKTVELMASTPKKPRLEKNKTAEIAELINILKEPVEEHDSTDYYCMSLAKDMKNMEPEEQWRIRLEITKIMATAKFKK